MHKVVSTDPDEVRLYCYSEERANKERAIVEPFRHPLRGCIGGLPARPSACIEDEAFRVASHYQIGVTADETGEKAAVTWTRRPRDGSMARHPGVQPAR